MHQHIGGENRTKYEKRQTRDTINGMSIERPRRDLTWTRVGLIPEIRLASPCFLRERRSNEVGTASFVGASLENMCDGMYSTYGTWGFVHPHTVARLAGPAGSRISKDTRATYTTRVQVASLFVALKDYRHRTRLW